MNKENTLLVLWIIFGFIFITAIDSILYFSIHLIYFGLAELGVSYTIMTVLIPSITLILYVLTAFVLINRIKIKSNIAGIYLTEFPKKWMIILGIIAFALAPITDKLSGMYAENNSESIHVGTSEWLTFYGWFYIGLGVSQLLVLGILVVMFFVELKNLNNN
jgi:hypothetical protein